MKTFKHSRLMLGAVLLALGFSAAAQKAGPRDQYGRLRVVVSAEAETAGSKCREFRRVGPGNKGPSVPEYAWVNVCPDPQAAARAGFRLGPPFMWFGVKY